MDIATDVRLCGVGARVEVVVLVAMAFLGVGCLRDFDRDLIAGGSGGGGAFLSVSAGATSSCAVRSDGGLWCWGSTDFFQLGAPVSGMVSLPVRVTGEWLSVSTSTNTEAHSCAIARDGSLHCWGEGSNGQLGLGDSEVAELPTQVGSQTDWLQSDGGTVFRCGVREGGAMFCAGWAANGRLGFSPEGSYARVPQRVPLDAPIVSFDCHDTHTLALDSEGGLWSWGGPNASGELGRSGGVGTPDLVQPGELYSDVSTGRGHSCGVRQDGSLWCWGENDRGQLGRMDAPGGIEPVEVEGGVAFRTVSCGEDFCCAITRDSELYCWGANGSGQLGIGGGADVPVPTRVGTRSEWTRVSAGVIHACATDAENLFCWGSSSHGQNGQGGSTDVPAVIFLEDE